MAPSLTLAAAVAPERAPTPPTDMRGGSSMGGGTDGLTGMVTRGAALAPRPNLWPVRTLLALAGTTAGYAYSCEVDHPHVAVPLAAVGVTVSLQQALTGIRTARRTGLVDDLTEALTPLLGLRKPSRRHVRTSRWNGWWVGNPGRIKLTYARGAVNTEHPRWRKEILAATSRLLGIDYEIVRHDARAGVLHLRPKHRDASLSPRLEHEVLRAERTLRELLGPTARITPHFTEPESLAASADSDEDSEQVAAHQIVALDVHHQAGARLASAAHRTRVERSVSAMMPGRWRAHFKLEQDFVRFELRPTLPTRVPSPAPHVHDIDPLVNYDQVAIPLGVDEDAETALWRPAIDPHLMVVGPTGSGKTVLLHNVVARFANWGWPVHIADGKGVEFLGFREWPNVQTVATSVEEQVALIHAVRQLMEERYAAIIAGKAMETDFEPIVLVLDEFRDFYGNLMEWYSATRVTGRGGDPTKPPVLEAVKSIARKARTARVHLVLGTQRPDADFLSGEMRDNFRARVALGRMSPQGSVMMWDSAAAAVAIPKIRGRGTTLNDDGRVIEIQTFWTPDPRKVRADQHEDLDILRGLRPATTQHERLVIVPPDPKELGDGKKDEVRYHQWSNPYLQPSLASGLGTRSSHHLREVARILPLTLRPDLATRPLLSPALAAEWLPGEGAAFCKGTVDDDADHLGGSADYDGSREGGEREDIFAIGEAVTVERDPRVGRHIPVDATTSLRKPPAQLNPGWDDYADVHDEEDVTDDEDPFAGYGDVTEVLVDDLQAGCLVLVDEETQQWAVLEADPEPDIDEPDLRCLEWRDDVDDAGSLSLDANALITTRLPLDEDLDVTPHDDAPSTPPAGASRRRASATRADRSQPADPVSAAPGRGRKGASPATRGSAPVDPTPGTTDSGRVGRPQRVRALSRRAPAIPAADTAAPGVHRTPAPAGDVRHRRGEELRPSGQGRDRAQEPSGGEVSSASGVSPDLDGEPVVTRKHLRVIR